MAALALAGTGDLAWAQQATSQPQTQQPTPAQLAARAQAAAERVRRARERLRGAEREARAAERAVRRWTSVELRAFSSEDDFNAYVAASRRHARAVDAVDAARWDLRYSERLVSPARAPATRPAKAQQPEGDPPPCDPDDALCSADVTAGGSVIVTGSRIVASPLTNNQEQGVDEGDVVKQIGQYLLVLQDGRIFVVDTEAGEGRDELRLVDRADVYRDPEDEAWYDELVVHGDRVLVTGFAYEAEASELVIFRLGEGGRLTREGVFRLKSEDYYDRNNYAARVIGDELILYTPIRLDQEEPRAFQWPALRREDQAAGGERLLRPAQLYRPLSILQRPIIHMVTRCRLGSYWPGGDIGCTAQGFVAAESRQFYVANGNAYLWNLADDSWTPSYDQPSCTPGRRPRRSEADAAFVHRVSLTGAPLAAIGATGMPIDQLGMDASGGRFRALVAWVPSDCRPIKDASLHYFEIGDSAFGQRVTQAPDSAFTAMPTITGTEIENRFTDDYLVFGARPQAGYRYRDEENNGMPGGGHAVVVPIGRPREAQSIWLPHRVLRVERVGDDTVLTGYEGRDGLDVSLIDLDAGPPRLASTTRLEARVETEGRSHAFNSLVAEDGSGLAGVPTVLRTGDDEDRYAWRSKPSDISFLSIDAAGRLQSLGSLRSRAEGERRRYDDDPDEGSYSCEVSCIDWYGNSRPLFTRGRIFALTATELVEGRIADGRIDEIQRIDLTKTELPGHLPRPTPAGESD